MFVVVSMKFHFKTPFGALSFFPHDHHRLSGSSHAHIMDCERNTRAEKILTTTHHVDSEKAKKKYKTNKK